VLSLLWSLSYSPSSILHSIHGHDDEPALKAWQANVGRLLLLPLHVATLKVATSVSRVLGTCVAHVALVVWVVLLFVLWVVDFGFWAMATCYKSTTLATPAAQLKFATRHANSIENKNKNYV